MRPVRLVRRGDARRRGRARHGPGANIRYYGAASCFDNDLLDALARVVDDDKAQLVTNSWGDAGRGRGRRRTIAAYEQIFLQGAIAGHQLHVLLR